MIVSFTYPTTEQCFNAVERWEEQHHLDDAIVCGQSEPTLNRETGMVTVEVYYQPIEPKREPMPVPDELRNLVAAFAKGECPQAVLADWLEENHDERAQRVRETKVTREDIGTASNLAVQRLWPRFNEAIWYGRMTIERTPEDTTWVQAKVLSIVRRRVLALFPECYPSIVIGQPLACLEGVGVCAAEEGEQILGYALEKPNAEGFFRAKEINNGTYVGDWMVRVGLYTAPVVTSWSAASGDIRANLREVAARMLRDA
jgi:hypothetical protein